MEFPTQRIPLGEADAFNLALPFGSNNPNSQKASKATNKEEKGSSPPHSISSHPIQTLVPDHELALTMETTDEIELVLEKICDIHDKLSNAIHSISRSHFLNSIKNISIDDESNTNGGGYVFMKDVRTAVDDAVIADVRSLNSIRVAVENLQHQLEFLHTVQLQQRAERDVAIARLEQSRIVLAMRLVNHQGKKYKVIEEALAFVGNVDNVGHFISPEHVIESPGSQSGEDSKGNGRKRSNFLMRTLASGLSFAKKSLNLSPMGSLLGHAALVAVSMIALLHLPPSSKSNFPQIQDNSFYTKNSKKTSESNISSSSGFVKHLDVLAARG